MYTTGSPTKKKKIYTLAYIGYKVLTFDNWQFNKGKYALWNSDRPDLICYRNTCDIYRTFKAAKDQARMLYEIDQSVESYLDSLDFEAGNNGV